MLLLHTSRDPIVPELANNDKYEALIQSTGNEDFIVRRVVDRFGHGTFSPAEIAAGFTELVAWVEAGKKPLPKTRATVRSWRQRARGTGNKAGDRARRQREPFRASTLYARWREFKRICQRG